MAAISGRGEIGFVFGDEGVVRVESFEDVLGEIGEVCRGVEDEDGEVGFVGDLEGAFDALAFEIAGGLAESGGVNEFEVKAAEGDAFGDEVAGGAGGVADDGPVLVEENVEEAAFAGVGGSQDGEADALGEGIVKLVGFDEAIDFVEDLSQLCQWACLVFFGEVFFGEIDVGFEVSTEGGQFFDQGSDFVSNSTSQVSMGDFQGFFAFGMDQFHDSFGLGKIHPAVEESGSCELSGFGQLATSGFEIFEDLSSNEGVSVAGNFEYILASVGMPFGEVGVEDFVNDLAIDTAISAQVGLPGSGCF